MFDFLFEKKDGETVSYLDLLTKDIDQLNVSKFALHKAVDMIAKAVGKSEILLQNSDGSFRKDEVYYRLNVQPNDIETGTEFWMKATHRLLLQSECLIVMLHKKLYLADSWTASNSILAPRRYTHVCVSAGEQTLDLNRSFSSDEVINLRYHNEKIRDYLNLIGAQYDRAISNANTALKMASAPKFKVRMSAQNSLRDRDTNKVLTKDQYLDRVIESLKDDKIGVFWLGEGMDLEQLKIETDTDPDFLKKLSDEENRRAAMAFDIPIAAFNGEITEKSDASNEFITYAVSPVVETINDGLNAKIVGLKDYVSKGKKNGERAVIWTGNFKHADLVEAASGLEKLRGIGFSFDECREAVGYIPLNTPFSTERALTKNIGAENQNMVSEGEEEWQKTN